MKWFLFVYDNRTAELEVSAFEDASQAIPVLNSREAAKAPHEEVVLFRAASLDDLRRTHSRYFTAGVQPPVTTYA